MAFRQGLIKVEANVARTSTPGPAQGRNRFSARIIGTFTLVLLAGGQAFGQIAVQPMILNKAVQPGRRFVAAITLQNQQRDISEKITLSLLELTQASDGMWQEFRPDDPNFANVSLAKSCREWLQLPKETFEISPLGSQPINLAIRVPAGVRGHHFAALVARSEPRLVEEEGMVTAFAMEYIVPIILEVQGIAVQQKVELVDANLEFFPQTIEKPASTQARITIKNNGGTFSHVVGMIRVWGQWQGHERKVADLRFRPTAIIPGVEFNLAQNIERFLPEGTYKLEAFIYVDGRRGNVIRKEVPFVGDPRARAADGAKSDVPLDVAPMDVVIDAVPGATRTTYITVQNGSEEVVNVNAAVVMPAHMRQAFTSKGVKGEELTCADWVRVNPAQFSLQPFARRNVGLIAQVPRTATAHPNYYGVLTLGATYPDGQQAGSAAARVSVNNTRIAGTPEATADLMSIVETSPSRYIVTATFVNTGETHIQPQCQGALQFGSESAPSARFLMTSNEAYRQDSMMMPMEARMFSGVLDISGLVDGTYVLTSLLTYGEQGRVQQQRAIEIKAEGGQKVATVVDMSQVPRPVIKL